jgi:chromosome segregation ATPase
VLESQESVGDRETEIAKLQEGLAKRDRENKEISDRFGYLLREKNDLEAQHQAMMAEWDERYSKDTAELEQRIQVASEEHERSLAEMRAEVEGAQEQTARIRSELEDTKQRHGDEVYGLRTRYRNENEKLTQEMNGVKQQLEQTRQQLDSEIAAHEATRQDAAQLPGLQADLQHARETISALEQQVADLRKDIASHEDRVVKAYQKIKSDEKIKEKARKAVEIAMTLLSDQVAPDDRGEGLPATDEAQN